MFLTLFTDFISESLAMKQYFDQAVGAERQKINKQQSKALLKSKVNKETIDRLENALKVFASKHIVKLHRELLPMIPNLSSLSVDSRLSADPVRKLTDAGLRAWFPSVLRMLIHALADRADNPLMKPVAHFSFSYLFKECFILNRQDISLIPKAFQHIKTFSLGLDPSESSGPKPSVTYWYSIVGFILESAPKLEDLILYSRGGANGRELFASALVRTKPLASPSVIWPNLQDLNLRDIVFTRLALSKVIGSMIFSLRRLALIHCQLDQDITERGHKEADWRAFFRDLRQTMTRLQIRNLRAIRLTDLDLPEHNHLAEDELAEWEKWLLNQQEAEPIPNNEPIFRENCPVCHFAQFHATDDVDELHPQGPNPFGMVFYPI
jgi:hypothetical protein